ncbi:MAG TPA: hypothetical protein VN278_04110 [Methanosarcina sp.]|nr:hypothetical protein [Methanosarcina sp.]
MSNYPLSPVTNDDSSSSVISHTADEQAFSQYQDNNSQSFTLNPFYSCRCRRGYSLSSDPFFEWKIQEEPADYSRKDIARTYRLGEWY